MRPTQARIARAIQLIAISLTACGLLLPLECVAQDAFYHGKTITLIQGRGPGGTGDMRVKAIVPLLQKYIPGNPTIVNEYMAGGGGRKASNHIYGGVRPDGLTIGNVGIGLISGAILGETGIQYDLDKLVYLGAPISARHMIFFSRGEAGLSSLDKLRAAVGIRIGAESVGHSGLHTGKDFRVVARAKGSEIRYRLCAGGNRRRADARRDRCSCYECRLHSATSPRLDREKVDAFSCDHGRAQRSQRRPLRLSSRIGYLRQFRARTAIAGHASCVLVARPALYCSPWRAERSNEDPAGGVPQGVQRSGIPLQLSKARGR